jgi:hypothetical protein
MFLEWLGLIEGQKLSEIQHSNFVMFILILL